MYEYLCVYLQEAEERQAQDELMLATDKGRGKGKGKGKQKVIKVRTEPSPDGRRILESIEELRSKYARYRVMASWLDLILIITLAK